MNIEELLALDDLPRLGLGNVQDWQQLANEPIEQAGGFAWSSGGAAWSDHRELTLISHGRRCVLEGHTGFVAGLAFSPEGFGKELPLEREQKQALGTIEA